MDYISDTALNHLLKVMAYLKAAENEFEIAASTEDWLADTVDTDGLVSFQSEVSNYIACNVETVCISDADYETLARLKGQLNSWLAGKIKVAGNKIAIEELSKPGKKKWPRAKLDEDRVKTILGLVKSGCDYTDVGKRFGVTYKCIRDIARGVTWREVPRPAGLPKPCRTASFTRRIRL